MRLLRGVLAISCATVLLACGDKGATALVVAPSSEAPIPTEMTSVHLLVTRDGATKVDTSAPDRFDVPGTITLANGSSESTSDPVLITLTGALKNGASIKRQARLGFVSEDTKLLKLRLERICEDMPCVDGQTTCVAGACVSIDIDPTTLPDFSSNDDATAGEGSAGAKEGGGAGGAAAHGGSAGAGASAGTHDGTGGSAGTKGGSGGMGGATAAGGHAGASGGQAGAAGKAGAGAAGVSGAGGQGGAGMAGSSSGGVGGGTSGNGGSGGGGGPGLCGNGVIDAGEQCDGANLNGKASCADATGQPGASGTFGACKGDCTFDLSMCVYCGDGVRDGFEPCEGADVGGATCASIIGTTATGTLACSAHCGLDTTMCTPSTPCGDTTGLESGAPWPMLGRCPTRAARAEVVGPDFPVVAWSAAGDEIYSSLVGADGTVFWGTQAFSSAGTALAERPGAVDLLRADGGFLSGGSAAYDASGALEWNYDLSADVTTVGEQNIGPDGSLYATTNAAELYAFTSTGAALWSFTAGGGSHPTVAKDGTIYVSDAGFRLVALDSSGATKWTGPINAARPVVGADGTIYVAIGTQLAAVDGATGAEHWIVSLPNVSGTVAYHALASDGAIYVASGDGAEVLAFEPDGSLRWTAAIPNPASASMLVVDAANTVYVLEPGSGTAAVIAVTSDGTIKWTKSFPTTSGGGGSLSIGGDGTLYVGVDSLYALKTGPMPVCGNGTIEGNEQCDTADFGATPTCSSFEKKASKGALACRSDCTIDATACEYCGDGVRNGWDACEGSDLGNASCQSVIGPAATGTLSCSPHCQFDTSGCTPSIACGPTGGLEANAPWPMAGYCATRPGRSSFVGPQTDTPIWNKPTPSTNPFALGASDVIVAADGTSYLGWSTGTQARDASGVFKWLGPSNGLQSAGAIGADGTIYRTSCTADGNLCALAPSNGSVLWSGSLADLGNSGGSAPAIGGDGTIYEMVSQNIGGPLGSFLAAYSPQGALLWTTTLFAGSSGELPSPTLGLDGSIYAVVAQQMFHVSPSGSILASQSIPNGAGYSVPTVGADGTVYLASGDLLAFAPDLTPTWKLSDVLGKSAPYLGTGLALAADGTIYAGCSAIHPDGTFAWTAASCGVGSLPAPAVGSDGTIYIEGAGAQAFTPAGAGLFATPMTASGNYSPVLAIGLNGTLIFGGHDATVYAIGP